VKPAQPAAALILDADNISDAAAIDRVVAALQERGYRLTVRRAYGGHEKLAGLKECLARHGFRALVNHGKGTTDALLVVDVMDLFHAGSLPETVALASSDGDFAPLVVRLREAGSWTICFAQRNKSAGEELAKAYDEVAFVDALSTAPPPAAKAPRKTAARKRVTARREEAPADPVRQVLAGIAGFDDGEWIALNDAVKRLRDAGLMARSASGPRFFAKGAPYVELMPGKQPNKLRLKAR